MVTAYLFEWSHLKQTDIQSLLTDLSWTGWANGGNVVYDTAKGRGKITAILVWHTYEAFSLYMETIFNQALLKNGLPMPRIRAWPVNGKAGTTPPVAATPVILPKLDLIGGMQNPGI